MWRKTGKPQRHPRHVLRVRCGKLGKAKRNLALSLPLQLSDPPELGGNRLATPNKRAGRHPAAPTAFRGSLATAYRGGDPTSREVLDASTTLQLPAFL